MTTENNTTITPSNINIDQRLELIDQLKSWLISAPDSQQETMNQYHLITSGESVSCVKWNDAFYISGTDIVRCLVFRFLLFGRPVQNLKKFEEGIFSDLRNLKPGTDAILEEPKSAFLDLLFKHNCIRTQKKQKVFYWYSVPHDRLFLDALERDLKREKIGVEPTSVAVAHPAVTISLDTTQAMFDEFRKAMLSELNLDSFYRQSNTISSNSSVISDISSPDTSPDTSREGDQQHKAATTIFGQFSLFEGSPTYKQRRRRASCSNNTNRQVLVEKKRNNSSSTTDEDLTTQHSSSATASTRSFNCPLSTCGKVFKRLEHMKRHLRTHTMERPYLCDLCGKRFSRSDNLAQHKKTHERGRPSANSNKKQYEEDDMMNDNDENENYEENEENEDEHEEEEDENDEDYHASGLLKRKGGGIISAAIAARNSYPAVTSTNSRFLRRHASVTRRRHHAQHRRNNSQAVPPPTLTIEISTPVNHNVATEVMYGSDYWAAATPAYQHLEKSSLLQPELSNSTASNSTASSCDSSPIYSRLPTVKVEDTTSDLYYQQQNYDTNMMMVEELLPQQRQHQHLQQIQYYYGEEDQEEEVDWQRRIDWNQYTVNRSTFGLEELMMYEEQQQEHGYYLPQNSYYTTTAASSNTSSCVNSPALFHLSINTRTTNTANSSPMTRGSDDFNSSTTMTPTDCLLYH